jgi:predicted HTH transcriptional regulator
MIDSLKIENINETDIQNLIVNSISERMNLEFKRDVFGGSDEAKREILKDISALANSMGGDLVIGIEATDGIAKSIFPITGTPADKEILRLAGC